MCRLLASLLLVLLPLSLAAGGELEVEEPVTYLGATMLSRADLVVRGETASTSRFDVGAGLTVFPVEEVLAGVEKRKTILLITGDPQAVPPRGVPAILFLARLGPGRYRSVGRVDVLGAEGKVREATLREYLEIERLPDPEKKRPALLRLLLDNLVSADRFRIFSAARELAHFCRRHASLLSPEDIAVVRAARDRATDRLLRELLASVLAATSDGGKEEPDPEPAREGESLLSRTPHVRERKELLARWDSRPESVMERREIVLALSARHIRQAEPVFTAAIDDPDAEVRAAAARGLGEGGFRQRVPELKRLLVRDDNPGVRRATIQALGVLKAEEALPDLLVLGREPDLRSSVALAVARIRTARAVEWLNNLRAGHPGDTEEDRRVRRLVDFLLSEAFLEQERALEAIRAR